MYDDRRTAGLVGNSHVQWLSIVAEDADVLVRPLTGDRAGSRNVGEYGLTGQRGIVAGQRQTDVDILAHRNILRSCARYRLPRRTVSRM